MKSINRVLKYLDHTKNLVIEFSAESDHTNSHHSEMNKIFLISSDVSFADDSKTRHNSQEYVFKLFNDFIDWKSFKQRTIITNFTEIELLTISSIEKELIWWERFFETIHFRIDHKSIIECDNSQTIRVLINNKLVIKLRHVDIHKHWLRQKIVSDKIEIEWVSTIKILVDELTKILFS